MAPVAVTPEAACPYPSPGAGAAQQPSASELLRLCAVVYEDLATLATTTTCTGGGAAAQQLRQVGGDHACRYTNIVDISDRRWDVDAFMASRGVHHPQVRFGPVRSPKTAETAHPSDLVVVVRGTESWGDIRADLKVCKSGKADASCLTRVHCGFLACAYALLDQVHRRLLKLQTQHVPSGRRQGEGEGTDAAESIHQRPRIRP